MHFCAAIANFRIIEIAVDDVPWKDEVAGPPAVIEAGQLVLPEAGQLVLPEGPGWGGGGENEAVVRAPPPRGCAAPPH